MIIILVMGFDTTNKESGMGKVTVKIGVEKWSNLVSYNKDKK